MKLAQNLIGLPVLSIVGGTEVGRVKDVYLDDQLNYVTAIGLGSDRLLDRKKVFVRQSDVVTLGQDAIMIQNEDRVFDESDTPEVGEWLGRWIRRDALKGLMMATAGGTQIGTIADIILDEEATLTGFSLSQVYVSGPLAENRTVNRMALLEPIGDLEAGSITIKLSEAERADLRIAHEGIFSKPRVETASLESA